MTDDEFEEAKLLGGGNLTKEQIENALIHYGAGSDGWGDLFDYEKPRVIKRAIMILYDRCTW